MGPMTYGIELELCDIDNTKELPDGWYRTFDPDICNSNGIAAAEDYPYGSELNCKPFSKVMDMFRSIKELLSIFPEAVVNHKSVTHVHIGWEGACDDIEHLKKILQYTRANGQWFIDNHWTFLITPEMNRNTKSFRSFDRKVMNNLRYDACMAATDVKSFREAHAMCADNKIVWPTLKRYAVNLYGLWSGGAIEFRWGHPSVNPSEILDLILFNERYVIEALGPKRPVQDWVSEFNLPKEFPFDPVLEKRWLATNTKYNPMETVIENRRKILEGEL